MRGWGIVLLPVVGCGSEIAVVPPCPVSPQEVHAVETAARHLDAFRGRQRLSVTTACAGLVNELTGGEVALQRPLSQPSAFAICAQGKAAVEERLATDIEVAAGVVDFGGCDRHLAAEQTCRTDCGDTPLCISACAAASMFQAGCRAPVLEVASTDGDLERALQTHFGAILALDLFVANHAGDGKDHLDAASVQLRGELGDGRACASERAALDAVSEASETTFREVIDLLSWVRLSRLPILE